IAVGFGMRAIDESEDDASAAAAQRTETVLLTEFQIPDVTLAVGGALHVVNQGTAAHNLAIEGVDVVTADLAAGQSEHLDLSALGAGAYTMYCTIPGHRDAGMEAELIIGEGAATGGAS